MAARKKESTSDVKQRPPLGTPTVMSTPSRSGLYHLRERLERQIENSQGKLDKQISPTLEKLKMTPGRVLKDRELLASKHSSVRQKADKLNVGGGVCLWPGMDDMRLSRREIIEILIVSVFLLVAVVIAFNKLHGSTIEELYKYHNVLKDFHGNHYISVSQSSLDSGLQRWHKEYRKLIQQIHSSFDMSRVPLMYVMYMLVYCGGMGFLIYFLVDNMFAKSKLSPNRIKQWVSILVVISTWTGALFYFLMVAYLVESAIESNVTRLVYVLGEALEQNADITKLSNMISYWRTVPQTGTLTLLGLVTIRDVMHYIQYYFIPIMTILITPIVKLVISLYSVYTFSSEQYNRQGH
ncbi:uncharacterized protein LOC143073443 [Mytilus galloprovincialis]|uniref:uncharacterized protein LOC143073443 n=1 Tax=Mytilus galloprovincialis TaxID=29158 RepID=UPI003F7B9A70